MENGLAGGGSAVCVCEEGEVKMSHASFPAPLHRGLLPTSRHRRGDEMLVLSRFPP